MKNIMKKGICALAIIAMCVVACSVATYATEYSSMITTINSKGDSSNASESAQNIVGAILAIAKVIAVGVALIMLVVLAIKYMSAAPGDKADIKKHAVVYVVGALVLFGSAGILEIIQQFSKNISAGTETTGD